MRTFCNSLLYSTLQKLSSGAKFLIVTDHRALTWLYSFKEPGGFLARWIEKLGEFDFEIKQEAGKKIPHADCLSRVPQTEDQVKDCNQVNQINSEEKNICSIGQRNLLNN